VQVELMNITLKAPGIKRLELKHDLLLSTLAGDQLALLHNG
jgi:hypothetical protein